MPLTEDALRPGTIYADPYGHVLVLVKRVPQTGDGAGVFLAVDGQPDGTVARKRFWRGNFLFAQDPALGSPGFKRFRPIVREKNGTLRRMANAEITKDRDYGDYSLEQSKLSVEDFYDRMDDVMSPAPLEPMRAMKEAITALEEQVNARVASVEKGASIVEGGREVAMPDGASIFETTGAWEDFATPSRDLRLLIAVDVVRGFPDRVARRPSATRCRRGRAQRRSRRSWTRRSPRSSQRGSFPIRGTTARSGRSSSRMCPTACRRWRWRTTSTIAPSCAGARPKAAGGRDVQAARAGGAASEDGVSIAPGFSERRRPPRG